MVSLAANAYDSDEDNDMDVDDAEGVGRRPPLSPLIFNPSRPLYLTATAGPPLLHKGPHTEQQRSWKPLPLAHARGH